MPRKQLTPLELSKLRRPEPDIVVDVSDITGLGTLATQNGVFSGTSSGVNTGDQTSIVGITGTKSEFDGAVTDGDFAYAGDAPTAHTHPQSDVTNLVTDLAAKQATLVSGTSIKTINGASVLGAGDIVISGGSGNAVAVVVDFGAGFNDRAQTVVTGQAWVLADSKITTQVLCPSVTDPDELYLLNFIPVISNLVIGTGFTLTLYSQPQARGTYTVNCIGV